MAAHPNQTDLQREMADLRQELSVAFIATSDRMGKPESSHAPFIIDEHGGICILISRLALHTRNLLEFPRASVLLLEIPGECPNPFALRRLQFDCDAVFLERGSRRRGAVTGQLRERFGRFVNTLDSLGDFEVVSLQPFRGKYVRGFAQTFELSGDNLEQVVLVNPASRKGGD